ncbi:MAG: DUF4430 domain-containing protein [Candidatus Nanoarchaeia archaeon]|nr:DUF4430 domain-containing protein [Candidatus Nanoarchaeia archaeon]MDD5239226.1 DUF4430 domain-containing protein [Candidatus Nanoarchaeia archaeon]
MKLKMKSIVPLFLALVFFVSIFGVFTQSGSTKGKAQIVISFGLPDMTEQKEFSIAGNVTALELLSSYASYVEADHGDVRCIADYCSTNRSEWKFYVNNNIPEESAEKYVVKDGDLMTFRYEEIKKTTVNETV